MRIGILGTRGIPNYHGGFEQFAEHFSVYLKEMGHEVYVYCSSDHPFQQNAFKGVALIRCKDPEARIGTAGQFIYDLNCILDSRRRQFDILLQLGYTSSTVWHRLLPKDTCIVTNMDGLEWKRSKYSKPVRRFLKFAEKLAVKSSDHLIADSLGIQRYLKEAYRASSRFIAYGADLFEHPDQSILEKYGVDALGYDMLIARIEPENNIQLILDGVARANRKIPFLVIGKHDINAFGRHLTQRYVGHENIRFLGGIYNLEELNNLRYFSRLYFHGHSVGGTNPSLLEAMASNALIAAHSNDFNKAVLEDEALYFSFSDEVTTLLNEFSDKKEYQKFLDVNRDRITNFYSWEKVNKSYLDFFKELYGTA